MNIADQTALLREHAGSGEMGAGARAPYRFMWIPIPLAFVAMFVLWCADLQTPYESPYLLLGINFVSATLVSLFIAYLIGCSFLVKRTPALLFLGCGVLFWGSAGFVGAISALAQDGPVFDANTTVTIANTCCWLSALSHLVGAGLSLKRVNLLPEPKLWLSGAYVATFALVGLVTFATLQRWTPLFFVQGEGGTFLRQMAVGTAGTMFLLSALLLRFTNRQRSPFVSWYFLALLLLGESMLGLLGIQVVGSSLNWTIRGIQALGGIYVLMAAVASLKESGVAGISLQEALTEARQQFHDLFHLMADGVVVNDLAGNDRHGRFALANPAICDLLGYTPAEMAGLTLPGIIAPDDHESFTRDHEKMLRMGTLRHDRTLVTKDGVLIPVEISTRVFQQQGRPMAMSVIRDNSERKQAEEALRQAHEELEKRVEERTEELAQTINDLHDNEHLLLQQSRHAAMGEMLNNIAHQWRQPLNSLGLNVQRLPLFYSLGKFDEQFLTGSVAEAMALIRHMSSTIDDFRDFFKPDKQKVTFRVADVIGRAVALVGPSFRASDIDITVDTDDAVILGYPNEYSQVILNLLSNAKDAFESRATSHRQIVIRSRATGEKVVTTISDTAGGIPSEHLERVFDPYFTTKGPKGTGIGLFMAKNIIERNMCGLLSVQNTPEGAAFTMEV